jgi:hypothetical protein
MTDLLQPSTTEAPSAWSLPVFDRPRSGTDTFASFTNAGSCWQTVLADLLDQALTVDAFIEAARQAFGETCTVVPVGDSISMQQITPPQRIIITDMFNDMVTEACCY